MKREEKKKNKKNSHPMPLKFLHAMLKSLTMEALPDPSLNYYLPFSRAISSFSHQCQFNSKKIPLSLSLTPPRCPPLLSGIITYPLGQINLT
ncbi:hypothetical protein CEXT_38501 [Caerostris extrusa]|uniref:Uncharacterized protein n=1 Tax=Caerostris extrusa TaxID=172846 RepID=A0AAV4RH79_CAEEX|nr:hypothetical protein CEXT_38501 [Caerostris extrusa]